MRVKIKRLDIVSFARFQAVLAFFIGLMAGILYSFGGLVIDALVTLNLFSTPETPGLSFGTVLAFGALIGMPALFAIFGFMVGIIEAMLYNMFVKWFGGMELILKK